MIIPKTLVFHDCKQEALDVAIYNNSRLPKLLWNQGIIKHYHSNMSKEYLQQTHNDFSSDDGACCILHATVGASTGLDICGVHNDIQYGICKNMAEMVQCAGICGLFLLMAEQWVLNAALDNKPFDASDPNCPYAGMVKKNSLKQDRTGCAAIQLIHSTICLPQFFAKYLDDCSPTVLVGQD
ncbi:hypothetical protein PAXRUDRAFT_30500 [Paxillus rubicundulus Ve08.2h10]|uniref:Helicase C-terminal domain-containing protein n=1 Tax=Paxillus rubicundulus Ve08.2h10 TaxID=930991 RepID=A0A0D0E4W6_9AGAM|nr:hypothetical protein PAXRUDRAFT_30500 [Paxillus rubicundulus Ve08.2h10]